MGIYSSELPIGSKWPETGSREYIDLTIYEKCLFENSEETQKPGTNVSGELETFPELKRVEINQVILLRLL